MDLSQINPVVLVVGLACLCGVGFIVLTGLQIVGNVVGLISGLVEMLFGVLQGDPASGCGCLITVLGCGAVACVVLFASSVLATCGTPDAVRFCSLIGR